MGPGSAPSPEDAGAWPWHTVPGASAQQQQQQLNTLDAQITAYNALLQARRRGACAAARRGGSARVPPGAQAYGQCNQAQPGLGGVPKGR